MTKWANISTAPPATRNLWLRSALLILAGMAVLVTVGLVMQ